MVTTDSRLQCDCRLCVT